MNDERYWTVLIKITLKFTILHPFAINCFSLSIFFRLFQINFCKDTKIQRYKDTTVWIQRQLNPYHFRTVLHSFEIWIHSLYTEEYGLNEWILLFRKHFVKWVYFMDFFSLRSKLFCFCSSLISPIFPFSVCFLFSFFFQIALLLAEFSNLSEWILFNCSTAVSQT